MENVLIYGTIFDMTEDMSTEEVGLLFKGINSWRKGEEVVFEDRYLKGVWVGILPSLNTIKKNYDKKCDLNRINGKAGGRPKSKTKTDNPTPKAVKKEEPKAIKPETDIIPTEEVKTIATDKNNLSASKLVKVFRAIQISPNDPVPGSAS